MKILLATGMYPPDIGGPATYAKLLSDELPARGITVDVLSFAKARSIPKLFRHTIFCFKTIWHARSADVVFAQDAVSVGVPVLVAAMVLGKPFLLRVPGDHAWEQSCQRYGVDDSIDDFQNKKYGWRVELLRKTQKIVVDKADLVMAPSEYFAGLVRGWVKDPEKVSTVYNGIDIANALAIGKNSSPKSKTIVSAGRLVPWKGFDTLIRMMKKLPEWKLEIIGDGPEMGPLRKLITTEGVADRVSMVGRLDRTELLRKISDSEVFVLNSHFESFSYQAVEAMAVGTPVVISDIGSLPEIVDKGRAGRLVRPDDEAGFLAAIQEISADPALRARLSEAGKKRAGSFSIDATLKAVSEKVSDLHDHSSPKRTRRVKIAKIGRYLFSGGLAAGTDLGLLYIFTEVFGIWYLASSAIAFAIAFVVSFTFQKFFTFQDHGMDGVHGQATMYFVVAATNLAINTGLIYLLVNYGGLHYLLAQIISSIFIATESFIIYSMFIFKKKLHTGKIS